VHRQAEPPDLCPVCGAPAEAFEPFEDETPEAKPEPARFRCLNCGYLHQGAEPPRECPVCAAAQDRFEPLDEAAARAGVGEPTQVVVVGAGIAGLSTVEAIRAASPEAEITLISKEPSLPYYRLNLTRYLAGEIGADDLPMRGESWYQEQRVQLVRGDEVRSIHLDDLCVELREGGRQPFEKLVLALGAHPFVPPLPGVHRDGVTSFRTIEDAERIRDMAHAGDQCVCIGGGLLGLETAGALARIGADVMLLEGHGWLLPRQLHEEAGRLLESHVTGLGIKLRKRSRTAEILGDERVRGVLLEDDSVVHAGLAVVATGVRPNSYLARLSGLEVNQGVVVDNTLTTSHPNVHAAGDVAEHRGQTYGTWSASQSQGNIAGMNAAGLRAEFGGIPRSNTLKVLGLDLFSIGTIHPADGSFRTLDQEADGRYFRFVFHDSFMVGAILLGDTSLTAGVKAAVQNRKDFSGLLRQRPSALDVVDALEQQAAG